ncbi:phosphoglycerate mutase-like protein [Lindgomyces ingoldianus]|uniref:Phosphoglycerate mutase-like protein n=1 Tax=Lindgomyces ingoldianus TaxID=673940 RepID=A0ACB6R821_9PLEO|nr:phosphoglycerate mutase-like protein [Lindgomyces ingoldianus]KAF2475423.1 phosphoglycerate mutase-like protein [Lindgomyces ingoldianus]
MGKPRMIILVRHAQSEGNKNRDIHQFIPDHRVKLTPDGWNQAEEAGRRLRSMLKPDDTIQFFTSPYRRTRETTEGILRSLTSDDPKPSPFPRHKIKVFEEPRLREQDFGNFQPCSAEMERMWQERADYGHFFYRIPNGESAADAYDRVSGFNESMWRQFGEENFASVCVLVTHGLMTRVFLMKWYHWSVEYFEDLRNVNHCEFIVMKQSPTNGKYILENELRTWSDLKRRAVTATAANGSAVTPSSKGAPPAPGNFSSSPTIPIRRWGGCANGCNHDKINWPRRTMRKNTADYVSGALPAPPLPPATSNLDGEKDDHPIAAQDADHTPIITEPSPPKLPRKPSTTATKNALIPSMPLTPASPNDASNDASSSTDEGIGSSDGEEAAASAPQTLQNPAPRAAAILRHLHPGRDFGGTRSGAPSTPGEGFSDDSDYFPGMQHAHAHAHAHAHHGYTHSNLHHSSPGKSKNDSSNGKSRLRASSKHRQQSKERKAAAARKMSAKNWMEESGMGLGARADALGDGDAGGGTSDDAAFRADASESGSEEKPILREALKGDMIVEEGGSDEERGGKMEDDLDVAVRERRIGEKEIEILKEGERKGFGEIY